MLGAHKKKIIRKLKFWKLEVSWQLTGLHTSQISLSPLHPYGDVQQALPWQTVTVSENQRLK